MSAPGRLRRLPTIVAVLAAVVASTLVAAPAQAAASAVEFSADGVSWSANPLASVFPADFRYVPGDVTSSTFYVRNARSAPTSLLVVVTDVSYSDDEIGDALTVSATDFGIGGFGAKPIRLVEKCAEVSTRRDLAPGEVLAVRIDVALSSTLDGAQGQLGRADFRLLVGQADREAPLTPEGCPTVGSLMPAFPGTGEASTIASTGATPPYAALGFAGFALGVGWMLIIAARRRRRNTTTT